MPVERPIEGLYSEQFGEAKLRSSAADHQARYRFAAEMFIQNNACYVADMGCGIGESTYFLNELMVGKGSNPSLLVGVDVSTDAIDIAKHRGIPNALFFSANLADPDFVSKIDGSGPFDGIVFAETLEHVSPPSAVSCALVNLRQLLEPNTGCLIITSPNRILTSGDRFRPFNPYHTQEYSVDELERELESSGLDIIAIYGQRPVPKEFLKTIRSLQYLANKTPKIREIFGKLIAGLIMLKSPDASVQPFSRETHESKYLVAVCKT